MFLSKHQETVFVIAVFEESKLPQNDTHSALHPVFNYLTKFINYIDFWGFFLNKLRPISSNHMNNFCQRKHEIVNPCHTLAFVVFKYVKT